MSAELAGIGGDIPEDIGKKAAELLLNEISVRGCTDTVHQHMMLVLMTMCPEDVSRIRLGPLTPRRLWQ